MNFSGAAYGLTPRLGSKIIAALLAFVLTFAGAKGVEYIRGERKAEDGGEKTDGIVESEKVPEEGVSASEKLFSSEGAKVISGESSAESVIIADITKMQIIAEKEKERVISCGELTVFAAAILVSRGIESGKINENEYAVCPASAQRRPNYSLSASVLSVGKKMTVKDILRCMLYQRGSSFAYTLAVHVSGSEEAFVSELNTLAGELKLTNTAFTNVCGADDGVAKTSAADTAVLMRYFLNDIRLREIFCSYERITVGNGENESSIYLTVANDFFVKECTESQAKADGILGGKTGFLQYGKWTVVLFAREETEYLAVILNCPSPFSEALRLYAAYV